MSRPCTLVILSLALALRASAQEGGFFSSETRLDSLARAFHTGDAVSTEAHRPVAQAIGDLDGDGDLDVALANYATSTTPRFSVLLNRGDGSFGTPVYYVTSGTTVDVEAADLDGDGDLDLAFTQGDYSSSGLSVLVFRNLGDGTFGPEQSFPTQLSPLGLAAADFDRDGDIDLVTANSGIHSADSITILDNDGAGNFTSSHLAIAGENPIQVATGDVNGDLFPDLVVTVRNGAPAFFLLVNDGTGQFNSPLAYNAGGTILSLPGIELADVDLDGDLDVLFARELEQYPVSTFALFRNDGLGNFGASTPLRAATLFGGAFDFAVGDVTGDAWPDILAVGFSSDGGYCLLEGDGLGGFLDGVTYKTGEMARAISLADMDNDGDPDVVVTSAGSHSLVVHKTEGVLPRLPEVLDTGAACAEADVADLDLDGDLDIVTCDSTIYQLMNSGDGTFQTTSFAPRLSILDHPHLRDLNGDQYPDLLMLKNTTRALGPYNLYVALNAGDGTFGPITSYGLGSSGTGDLDTLDADLDGDLDVVITEYLGQPGHDGRDVFLLLNQGDGQFDPPIVINLPEISRPERVVTADFNQDGKVDFVVQTLGQLAAFLSRGDGTFDPPQLSSTGGSYLAVADFDHDGFMDVASSGLLLSGLEAVWVSFGNGDGTFQDAVVYHDVFSLQNLGVGGLDAVDVNGDGYSDLVAGAWGGNYVSVRINGRDGTFDEYEHQVIHGFPSWVVSGEFDGQGGVDIAAVMSVTYPLGSAVSVLHSRGCQGVPYGLATAGTSGDPTLSTVGETRTGNGSLVLHADNLWGGMPAFVLISLVPDTLTLRCCTSLNVGFPLLLFRPTPVGGIPQPGMGDVTFPYPIPDDDALIGLRLYNQIIALDPGVVGGLAATRGLRVEICAGN